MTLQPAGICVTLFWQNRNRIHFHQKVGICQAGHKRHRNSGWVRPAPPNPLEDFKACLNRLPLHNIKVPLDDMFKLGTPGG
jgi:hypothetical protein